MNSKTKKTLKEAEKNATSSSVIICKDVYDNGAKAYCIFNCYEDLKAVIDTDEHMYEMFLSNKKCNFVYDFDITDEIGRANPRKRVNEVVSLTRDYLFDYFKESQDDEVLDKNKFKVNVYILKSPSTDSKDSFHVIFRMFYDNKNVYFENVLLCRNVYEYITKVKKANFIGIDKSMYSKNKAFRLLNQSKIAQKNRKLVFEDELLDKVNLTAKDNVLLTMGTYTPEKDDDIIINKEVSVKVKKIKADKLLRPETIDMDVIEELLKCINKPEAHDDWWKLGCILFCCGSDLETFKKFGKEKSPDNFEEFEDLYDNAWNQYENMNECKYQIASLYWLAKRDNPIMYEMFMRKIYKTDFVSCSDAELAELFKKRFSDKFIYSENRWYMFNEKTGIWKEDIVGVLPNVNKAMIELGNEILKSKIEDEKYKDRALSKINQVSSRKNIIDDCRRLLLVENNKFNNNPFVVPFDNGVFDLKTGIFRKGYFDEFITKTVGYKMFEYSATDEIDSYLKDVLIDEQLREYFINVLSISLEGINRRQEVYFLLGQIARNGKSTICELITEMFGPLGCRFPTNILTSSREQSSQSNSAMMILKDKRFGYCSEPEKNKQVNVACVKEITGDVISARELYGSQESFKVIATLFICQNTMSKLDGIDEGIRRRIRMIPFNTRFVDGEPKASNERKGNPNINKDKLKIELMSLLIKRYLRLKDNNFDFEIPEMVKLLSNECINDSDEIKHCLEDVYEKGDEDNFIRYKDIQNLIKNKRINVSRAELKQAVFQIFNAEFFDRKKVNGKDYKSIFLGLKEINEDEDDIEEDEL